MGKTFVLLPLECSCSTLIFLCLWNIDNCIKLVMQLSRCTNMFLFVLFTLSSISSLIEATDVKYCDKANYDVKISGVEIKPYPVSRGKTATLSIAASTDQMESGSENQIGDSPQIQNASEAQTEDDVVEVEASEISKRRLSADVWADFQILPVGKDKKQRCACKS